MNLPPSFEHEHAKGPHSASKYTTAYLLHNSRAALKRKNKMLYVYSLLKLNVKGAKLQPFKHNSSNRNQTGKLFKDARLLSFTQTGGVNMIKYVNGCLSNGRLSSKRKCRQSQRYPMYGTPIINADGKRKYPNGQFFSLNEIKPKANRAVFQKNKKCQEFVRAFVSQLNLFFIQATLTI